MKSAFLLSAFLFLSDTLIRTVIGSVGDSSMFFRSCNYECITSHCSPNEQEFSTENPRKFYEQTIFDRIFQWSCGNECQYQCMWRTVDYFVGNNWPVPQFNGKWPFIKMFGMQEPASVLFSLMNLGATIFSIRNLQKEIPRDSPCYWLWNVFYVICANGWLWSTVFHARDFPLTEFLDYAFAYSMVLASLYTFVIRMIHKKWILCLLTTGIFLSFYLNYFSYMGIGQISYSENLKVNIATGCLASLGWIVWSIGVRKRRRYSWKIALFYILLGVSVGLEVLDFPPLLWILDAHSLWHLSSFPLIFIHNSFIISDCKALTEEKQKVFPRELKKGV